MKDRSKFHYLDVSGAPEQLQAVMAIGANTSRRGVAPNELERLFDHMLPGRAVVREADGRPIVRGTRLYISLSHADGVSALAVAPFPVGIDVECVDPELYVLEFDPDLFGKQDFRALETCDATSRRDHFYQLWTAKEAHLKLYGRNLLFDPLPIVSGAPNTSTTWIARPAGRYCVGVSWSSSIASDRSLRPAWNALVDQPGPQQRMGARRPS